MDGMMQCSYRTCAAPRVIVYGQSRVFGIRCCGQYMLKVEAPASADDDQTLSLNKPRPYQCVHTIVYTTTGIICCQERHMIVKLTSTTNSEILWLCCTSEYRLQPIQRVRQHGGCFFFGGGGGGVELQYTTCDHTTVLLLFCTERHRHNSFFARLITLFAKT